MANIHYGNIGDVWKHLALAEILSIEQPRAYWESHAGSARYLLTPSPGREYGVCRFLESAGESPCLQGSAYRRVLGHGVQRGQLPVYPGSPLIAMTLLRDRAEDFLFCDIDPDSLDTIRQCARQFGLAEDAVRTEERDGIAVLSDSLSALSDDEAAATFAHVDPYDPSALSDNGVTSIDVFARLAHRQAKAMLWYGFRVRTERRELLAKVEDALAAGALDRPVWLGDITLDAIDIPDLTFDPGVLGCGVLCSSLGDGSIDACERLGEALAETYASAELPGGSAGRIKFTHATLGPTN